VSTLVPSQLPQRRILIADMVRRLKRDILVATNRLDALRG
jgi:hypothetical protein